VVGSYVSSSTNYLFVPNPKNGGGFGLLGDGSLAGPLYTPLDQNGRTGNGNSTNPNQFVHRKMQEKS